MSINKEIRCLKGGRRINPHESPFIHGLKPRGFQASRPLLVTVAAIAILGAKISAIERNLQAIESMVCQTVVHQYDEPLAEPLGTRIADIRQWSIAPIDAIAPL